MTLEQALHYIHAVCWKGSIPGLERIEALLDKMGHPERACKFVHVAGTHGKTTTTAMLSKILVDCGLDPAVHIGGDYDYISGSTRLGAKNVFVAEACEFHSSFLEMHPTVAIVLNIQEDHLDYYKDLADIANAFRKFVGKVPPEGVFIGNGEDENVLAIMKDAACRSETFGFAENCNWRPHGLTLDGEGRPSFTLTFHGEPVCEMTLRVAGQFNIMNAMAAMAAAHALGADMQKAAAALSTFENVHRRFELTSVTDGVKVYHDYGHNPVEMAGALSVAKLQHANRIWAVMQPHTYSRTKALSSACFRITSTAATRRTRSSSRISAPRARSIRAISTARCSSTPSPPPASTFISPPPSTIPSAICARTGSPAISS